MATRANYVKVGLFVIVGLLGVLGLGVALGTTATRREVAPVFTYFNESVQGLEVGAPVDFRGVKIGSVGEITIAPDHRMVQVRMDADVASMERLGLWQKGAFKAKVPPPAPPPDVRTQLGSQGLTGNRYVAVDFFDPAENPPPRLSFAPPANYVPAAKSLSKGLEDSVTKAMDRLAELADVTLTVMGRVDHVIAELERGRAGQVAVVTLRHAQSAMGELDRTLQGLRRSNIPDKADATLAAVGAAVDRFGKLIGHLDAGDGLLATTQQSVAAFGGVGQNLDGATRDLSQTLAEIREAASAVRWLADELDRQPDVLVKGRSGGQTR